MLGILKKILGDKATKDIKELQPFADKTNVEFNKLSALSNDQLRNKTVEFKQKINAHIKQELDQIKSLKKEAEKEGADILETEKTYDQIDKIEKDTNSKIEEVLLEILPEAFAVVKETARRFTENTEIEVTATDFDKTLAESNGHISIKGDSAIWQTEWLAGGVPVKWNMIHYDVQLIGGTSLHQGKIAEMQTGEGKTLVATLPVYLNALAGRGVHLVTVNDYLAKRDAEWMGPLYEFHGLSVDCIDKHQPNSEARRKAYNADITFGTNNEFGFDYLRDNMAQNPELLVQRKHHFAIVDEVDSVLIDDARTPLIISGPTDKEDKHEYFDLRPKVEQLVNNQRKLVTDLLVQAKKQLKGIDSGEPSKTDLGEGGVALLKSFRGLPKNKALIKYLNEFGVKSHLQKTENYYLQDNAKEMRKVDKDLFFVIDEKSNSIDLTDKGIDLISGKDNADFFVMPDLASELSAIEKSGESETDIKTKKEELIRDYSIKAERIHTLNQLLKAYTLFEKDVEYVVVENKVKIVDEQTGRIMEGRRYSDGLHQAIEAKENVTVEAATQTYATVTLQNYFRMYHKLAGMTGTAETEAQELWDIYKLDVVVIPTNRPIQRDDRQDLVYRTKREKYNSVIDQISIEVEKGRPVLVGTTSVEISELLSKMLKMKNIKHNVLNAKLHQKEADIVAEAGMKSVVTIATNMAGRGTDIKLSDEVKAAGGLAIIGTERHDSRRVDRQLRGRAGRQGDPGSSQFFVSLEDNLMRLFGSDRITKLMDRVGFKEGEVIQHGMISKSIERAQKKVEENNFGIRKRLLEYDDVMNAQREVIYKKRKHALYGDRLSVDISNMFYESVSAIVSSTKNGSDYEGFKMDLLTQFSMECPYDEVEFNRISIQDLTDDVYDKVYASYKEKSKKIGEQAMPLIKDLYENKSGQYKEMRIPFTDGIKSIAPTANLEKAYNNQGQELAISLEKGVTLALIDDQWKHHLREMDDLRQSVQLAVHEQKDPLLIYKFESFELFRKMINQMNQEVASFLIRAHLPEGDPNQNVGRSIPTQQKDLGSYETSKEDAAQTSGGGSQPNVPGQAPKRQPMIKQVPKIGRNDKVEIMNIQTYEKKTVKFKQAEPLLKSGVWQIVDQA